MLSMAVWLELKIEYWVSHTISFGTRGATHCYRAGSVWATRTQQQMRDKAVMQNRRHVLGCAPLSPLMLTTVFQLIPGIK